MNALPTPSSLAFRILDAVRTRDDEDILFAYTGVLALPSFSKENTETYSRVCLSPEIQPRFRERNCDCGKPSNDENPRFPLRARYVSKTVWAVFTGLVLKHVFRRQEEKGMHFLTPTSRDFRETDRIEKVEGDCCAPLSYSQRAPGPTSLPVLSYESHDVERKLNENDRSSVLLVLCCRETFFACITEASCLFLSLPFCVLNPNDPAKRREEILHRLRTVKIYSGEMQEQKKKNSCSLGNGAEGSEDYVCASDSHRNLIIWNDEDIHCLLCEAEMHCQKIYEARRKEEIGCKTPVVVAVQPQENDSVSANAGQNMGVNRKLEDLMYERWTRRSHAEGGHYFSHPSADRMNVMKNGHGFVEDSRSMKKQWSTGEMRDTIDRQQKCEPSDKDEMAYIMFTSGSSGPRPKGVMNTIGNLIAYYDGFCCHEKGLQILKHNPQYEMDRDSTNGSDSRLISPLFNTSFPVFLTLSTPYFDPSIGDMLCTILTPRPWTAAQICISSECLLEPSLINRLVQTIFCSCGQPVVDYYAEKDMCFSRPLIPTHIISTPAVWQLLTKETANLISKALSTCMAGCRGDNTSSEQEAGTLIKEEGEEHLYLPSSPSTSLSEPCRSDPFARSLYVFLGGEKISTSIIERWASAVSLYSLYGVTEATIYQAASFQILRSHHVNDISYTFMGWNNLQFVEPKKMEFLQDSLKQGDEAAGSSAGELTVGEILLCGPQVALGYLPDLLSGEEPVGCDAPFFTCGECGKRGFRTGDIGSLRCTENACATSIPISCKSHHDDGELPESMRVKLRNEHSNPFACFTPYCPPFSSFSYRVALWGRKDFQIKINGQRVSVEEVEGALQSFLKNVFSCVCGFGVPVGSTREKDSNSEDRATPQLLLCVYATLRHTTKLCKLQCKSSPSNSQEAEVKKKEDEELLDRLTPVWESLASIVLPPHMVPRYWLIEKAKTPIAYTATGKIHRAVIAEKWKVRNQQAKVSQRQENTKGLRSSRVPETGTSSLYETLEKGRAVDPPGQRLQSTVTLQELDAMTPTIVEEAHASTSGFSYNAIYDVVQQVWEKNFGLSSHPCTRPQTPEDTPILRGRSVDLLARHINFYHLGGDSLGALKVTREVYMRLGGTEEGIDRYGRLPRPFQPSVLLQHPRLGDYVERVLQLLEDERENHEYQNGATGRQSEMRKGEEWNDTRMPHPVTSNKETDTEQQARQEEDPAAGLASEEKALPLFPSFPSRVPCTALCVNNAFDGLSLKDSLPGGSSFRACASEPAHGDPLDITLDRREMPSASIFLSADSFNAVLELGEPNLLSLVLSEGLYDLSSWGGREEKGSTPLWGGSSRPRVVRTVPTPLHTLVNLYHILLAREEEESKGGRNRKRSCLRERTLKKEGGGEDPSASSNNSFRSVDSLSDHYLEMMGILVKDFGAKVTGTTPDGVTPAHLAAAGNKHTISLPLSPLSCPECSFCGIESHPAWKAMNNGICTVHHADFSSYCAFFSASRRAAPLRLLVSFGSPLGVRDRRGQTLLHFAARAGHVEAVEFILGSCRCCSSGPSSPAPDGGAISVLALLCERDKWQRTPAHWAALNGHLNVLQLMLLAVQNEEEKKEKESEGKGEKAVEVLMSRIKGKKWKPNRKKVLSAKDHYSSVAKKRTHLAYETITEIAVRVWCLTDEAETNARDVSSISNAIPQPVKESSEKLIIEKETRGASGEKHGRNLLLQVCTELAHWIEAA